MNYESEIIEEVEQFQLGENQFFSDEVFDDDFDLKEDLENLPI